jgi:probable rRNA maturation factor
MTVEVNNQTGTKIDPGRIKKVVKIWQRVHDCSELDLSVALVSDARIRKLNKEYRQKDQVTDVLSFPDDDGLGELILAPAQIRRQAPDSHNTFEQELVFMLVHGLYHLLGFEDDSESKKKLMIEKGQAFINKYLSK